MYLNLYFYFHPVAVISHDAKAYCRLEETRMKGRFCNKQMKGTR